jgi:hypothetical protein
MKIVSYCALILLVVPNILSSGCTKKTCDLRTSDLEDEISNARISDLRSKIQIVNENIGDCDKVVTELKAYNERRKGDLEKFKKNLNKLGHIYISSGCKEEGKAAFSRILEKGVKSGVVKDKTNCDRNLRNNCPDNWTDINRAMGDIVIAW